MRWRKHTHIHTPDPTHARYNTLSHTHTRTHSEQAILLVRGGNQTPSRQGVSPVNSRWLNCRHHRRAATLLTDRR